MALGEFIKHMSKSAMKTVTSESAKKLGKECVECYGSGIVCGTATDLVVRPALESYAKLLEKSKS